MADSVKEKKRFLFVCSQNKLRSPTGEEIFCQHPQVESDSAGLNHDAEVPLCPEQIEWADVIFVMEKIHRSKMNRKFGRYLAGKKVVVLGIPDDYAYMDPALVILLHSRCAAYLA
ncbi:MAG: low molecular weight protein tyrosine phosphatase family protein [Verrucomicrobiales bacterium]|nr:low molecular weight protein tyrosine phosphatase family protein [Verrucomicrobiales bacterium]